MMPREPKPIGEGATLSLVAPSFGCTTEPYRTRLEESIRILSSLGYRIEEGRNIRLNAGVASSNTPASRAKEFEEAYFGKGDAILSVGGGELMCEILPFVDFKAIRIAKPKWFVGFSDNTNLTFTLTTLADLVTVYGPCAGQFFSYPFRYATEDTFRLLKGDHLDKSGLAPPQGNLISHDGILYRVIQRRVFHRLHNFPPHESHLVQPLTKRSVTFHLCDDRTVTCM